jgi:hypothetical protein
MEGYPSPDISFKDKAHYFTGRLWIPNDLQLKNEIFDAVHNSNVAGKCDRI